MIVSFIVRRLFSALVAHVEPVLPVRQNVFAAHGGLKTRAAGGPCVAATWPLRLRSRGGRRRRRGRRWKS